MIRGKLVLPLVAIFVGTCFICPVGFSAQEKNGDGAGTLIAGEDDKPKAKKSKRKAKSSRSATKKSSSRATAKVRYGVVETDSGFVVMTTSERIKENKKLKDQYRAEMKEYLAAKKAAKKAKESFDEPKPVLKQLKSIGAFFKSEDDAKAHLEKVLRERGEPGGVESDAEGKVAKKKAGKS